jgi:hypothetical protein
MSIFFKLLLQLTPSHLFMFIVNERILRRSPNKSGHTPPRSVTIADTPANRVLLRNNFRCGIHKRETVYDQHSTTVDGVPVNREGMSIVRTLAIRAIAGMLNDIGGERLVGLRTT